MGGTDDRTDARGCWGTGARITFEFSYFIFFKTVALKAGRACMHVRAATTALAFFQFLCLQ